MALAAIGGFALAAAIMFWRILPVAPFRPTSLRPKTLLINFRLHWRDRGRAAVRRRLLPMVLCHPVLTILVTG